MPPKKKSTSKPLKILVKCSWSGARIPVPTSMSTETTTKNLTTSSTISQVISSISSSLPPLFTNPVEECNVNDPRQQPSIMYMRTSVLKRDWTVTKIGDFCQEGGSILLTLNLPKDIDDNADDNADVPAESMEPMDIDDVNVNPSPPTSTTSNSNSAKARTPKQAMKRILNTNFDTDSKECLSTVLKMVDNILSNNSAKFRSIRITNKTVHKKIISKKGGLDLMFTLGFEYDDVNVANSLSFDFDNSSARRNNDNGPSTSEMIILRPENEDRELLARARGELSDMLTVELNMPLDKVPTMPKIQQFPSLGTGAGASSSAGRGQTSSSQPSFDPFKSQSFNTQAAAAGAPNPNSIIPDGTTGKSSTERKLELLQKKQQKLEMSMQSLGDRGITAFLPGETGPIVSLRDLNEDGGGYSNRQHDSSLLAGQMKKKMEQRKKKEEGGFTTKSMRELERMKKAKVYSHAQLKICFPDGSWIEAKFLPTETITTVKNIVQSTFQPEHSATYQFDLYIAPPRRILSENKSLQEEGLVPAAKIHVSWIIGAGPVKGSPPGSFLQRQFYQNVAISSGNAAFPASVGLMDSNKGTSSSGKKGGKAGGLNNQESREEELMQRMLGKRKGLLGLGKGKDNGNAKSQDGGKKGSGKPKWFKG